MLFTTCLMFAGVADATPKTKTGSRKERPSSTRTPKLNKNAVPPGTEWWCPSGFDATGETNLACSRTKMQCRLDARHYVSAVQRDFGVRTNIQCGAPLERVACLSYKLVLQGVDAVSCYSTIRACTEQKAFFTKSADHDLVSRCTPTGSRKLKGRKPRVEDVSPGSGWWCYDGDDGRCFRTAQVCQEFRVEHLANSMNSSFTECAAQPQVSCLTAVLEPRQPPIDSCFPSKPRCGAEVLSMRGRARDDGFSSITICDQFE